MEQLITIKNGNKQNSVFSSEEMEKRLSKLRSNMETENIDAILFTSIPVSYTHLTLPTKA